MTVNGTANKVKTHLQDYGLKSIGGGQYMSNRPYSNGDKDSMGLILKIDSDEHGAYFDHVEGEGGSLWQLADRLGIEHPEKAPAKIEILNLETYAKNKGLEAEPFLRAGWQDCKKGGRPALRIKTKGGDRYRFLDGKKPKFSAWKFKPCFYGLDVALQIANHYDRPLILCNGEPSTIVGQYYRLPALSIPGGEAKPINEKLIAELKAKYSGGEIIIALDNDSTGLIGSVNFYKQLFIEGFKVRAIDFKLLTGVVFDGFDLADFCKIEKEQSYELLINGKEFDIELAEMAIGIKREACMDIYRGFGKVAQQATKEAEAKFSISGTEHLNDKSAERALMGGIFSKFDSVTFYTINNTLSPQDLTDPVLVALYNVMNRVFSNKHPNLTTDPHTIWEIIKRGDGLLRKKLNNKQELEALICELVLESGLLLEEQLIELATIIKDYSDRRRAMSVFKMGMGQANALNTSIEKTINQTQRALNQISLSADKTEIYQASDLVDDYLQHIDNAMNGGVTFFPLPIKELERRLVGLQPTEVTLLAGRPGMGKTALAIYTALFGARQGKRVLFFSLEMGKFQLMTRIISIITQEQGQHISIEKQVTGKLTQNERALIEKATIHFLSLPITIIDKPALTMAKISRLSKKEQLNNGNIDLIIGDYLGQIKPDLQMEKLSEASLATAIVNEWCILAKDLDTPVLLLHQLSRNVENRADKIPTLSDLRNGGEEPANKVITLFSEDYYDPTAPPGLIKVNIAKNRQGQTGSPITAIYLKDYGIFKDAVSTTVNLNGGGF